VNRIDFSSSILPFLAGVSVGAIAALLFTPKSGEELRSDVTDRVNQAAKQVRSGAKRVAKQAQSVADAITGDAEDFLEGGRDVYRKARRT
jgi:gas vesicle protein